MEFYRKDILKKEINDTIHIWMARGWEEKQDNLSTIIMDKKTKIDYWVKTAKNDWKVAQHLFDKKDYAYALFFGHLTIEKLLKALYVKKCDEISPFTHRLILLVEKMGLSVPPDRLELLETITDFNLEARYPDEKFAFYKKCTKKFAKTYLIKIEELMKWLQKEIRS